MSALIGNAMPQFVLKAADKRAADPVALGGAMCAAYPPAHALKPFASGTFATCWWPARGALYGDLGLDVSMLGESPWREVDWGAHGSTNARLGFVNFARNANGAPIPNATVRCFRTSTDELVSKVTCDANGYYIATTPYADGHYLTVHGVDGSTPVSGSSLDTLIPG